MQNPQNIVDPLEKAIITRDIASIDDIVRGLGRIQKRKDRAVQVQLANQALINRGPGMVVCDVRYDNEAEWVRNLGGLVIHVERPDASAVNPHSSESGVTKLPGDMTIVNTGTLGDLQLIVRELFV